MFLEENTGEMFFDLGLGKKKKCKNKQTGLQQTKKFLHSNRNINLWNGKIFANHVSVRC